MALPAGIIQVTSASRRVAGADLNRRLGAVHREIQTHFPFVVRISVALYDAATGEIKTFLYSPADTSPLRHYATPLASATWLDALRRTRQARVIDDLDATPLGDATHSKKIREGQYKGSYTVPIFDGDAFVGFVFFNSGEARAFTERVTQQLDLFVRIISLMIESDLRSSGTLAGSVHLLREISRFRDDETANHLSRMAYYSALIARSVAEAAGRDDDWVEHVRLFAPLHDVGKIAIPDAVLLKPGALTPDELRVMRGHPVLGESLLRNLVQAMALEKVPHIEGLFAIARHHHENWDGAGYPDGLRGEAIPLEARIVRIADVFDALTTRRCYKPAWPVAEAAAYLREGRGTLFDARCVDALLDGLPLAVAIMQRFGQSSSEAA